MPLPSARKFWRTAIHAILNRGWKERAMRGRQLREAVTRFEHRTIHRNLTPDVLRNISDGDLIQSVVDCVERRLPHGYVGVLPSDTAMSRGCASIYYYRVMDYDIWNGGFDQFLDGGETDVTRCTIEALQFLELREMADVVADAQLRFSRGEPTSQCDARYSELHLAAEQHIIHFIRERPDEFTTTNEA